MRIINIGDEVTSKNHCFGEVQILERKDQDVITVFMGHL